MRPAKAKTRTSSLHKIVKLRNPAKHSWLVAPHFATAAHLVTVDMSGPPQELTEQIRGGTAEFRPRLVALDVPRSVSKMGLATRGDRQHGNRLDMEARSVN